MNLNALISVVVPNYNHAPFLRQRIESILAQSYKNIELIILDDCSTDNSKKIIEQYREICSHIVYNDTNSGSTFKQWQKGIELAKGDYTWIAESDDFSDPLFLESLTGDIKWDDNTVLAFCDSSIWENEQIIENSNNWSIVHQRGELLSASGCFHGNHFCEKYLVNHCIISNVSSVLFNTAALKNYKFSGELVFCEDWLLYITLLQNNSFVYIRKSLNFFRKHPQTVRARKMEFLKIESLKVIEKSYILFKKNGLSVKQLKIAFAEWFFKDAWWESKYKITFKGLRNYIGNIKHASFSYLVKILYRYVRYNG